MRSRPRLRLAIMMPNATPLCWILSDGTAGMEAQAIGLANAMGLETVIKSIRPSGVLRVLPWLGRIPGVPMASGGDTLSPPYPDIAITCGRRHAGASIALKRVSSGKTYTIHIQDPRVAPSLFDALVVPDHDPSRGENVITTTGSLNRISDSILAREALAFTNQIGPLPAPLVAVNLGGDTQQYKVDEKMAARISQSLLELLNTTGCGLMISTSRRTGPALLAALEPLAERADTVIWTGDGPNPYLGFLGLADAIVVTADSINMVSEACSTGKPVYILPLGTEPRRRATFLDTIKSKGLAREFTGTLDDWKAPPLRETDRVAKRLITQLKDSGILG
jgi:uncharacterized protein